MGGLTAGRLATEADLGRPKAGRVPSEEMALSFVERGVRSVVMRFPSSVHGRGDHGFVPILINLARLKGFSAYPGDGTNRWAAVHRLDAAHLFRLALEGGAAWRAAARRGDEGIPVKEIAEVIGPQLDLPVKSIAREEAVDHFGFLGRFFSIDIPASSAATRNWMGWEPPQPGLIEDLEAGHYFERAETLAAASYPDPPSRTAARPSGPGGVIESDPEMRSRPCKPGGSRPANPRCRPSSRIFRLQGGLRPPY